MKIIQIKGVNSTRIEIASGDTYEEALNDLLDSINQGCVQDLDNCRLQLEN